MNDLTLFVGSETMIFMLSLLIQSTLIISLVLFFARWLRYQPALRHSVLLGGLICVCVCPLTTFLADRFDIPGVSIAWLSDVKGDSLEGGKSDSLTGSTPISHVDSALPNERRGPEISDELSSESEPEREIEEMAFSPSEFNSAKHENKDLSVTGQPTRGSEQFVKTNDTTTVLHDNSNATYSETNRSNIAGGIMLVPIWAKLANAVVLVWLAGIVFLSIRLLLAWRYLCHLRSNAREINRQEWGRLEKFREQVCQAVGVRQLPRMFVSDQLKGPIAFGLFHPVIVFPEEMTLELDDSQLRDILIHETAHIRRHDCLVVLLQRLVGGFFWPFPLVWRLNSRIDEAREDVCDNYVLAHTEAPQYSRTLLELTERASTPQAIPLTTGLWKSQRKLEQRVVALLDPRRVTKTRLTGRALIRLSVAFVLVAATLTGSRFTRKSQAQAAAPQQPVSGTNQIDRANLQRESTEQEGMSDKIVREVIPAAVQADPYDVLYDVVMTRYKDGKAYGQDETSPAIFSWSEFPFGDRTFVKFNSALDAFAALPQDRIDQYSNVRRALLQRHLWEVFDSTFNWNWSGDWYWGGRKAFPKTHMARRIALQPKIAALIRRLALTKEQILKLPDPLAATVRSGKFQRIHDPADAFKPFLPSDLMAEKSSWVCVGESESAVPAATHTGKLKSRSIFLQFMRLPGGRKATLEYMERIKKRPEQFPSGTQFALLEQAFLISRDKELVLSPMIVSVQLRAYLDVGRRFRASGENKAITQCVAEFVMQPRRLMKGDAIMKAISQSDFRYDAGSPFAAGFSPRDPFASGEIAGRMPRATRLNLCMNCHGSAGGRGVMTKSFETTRSFFTDVNTDIVREATQSVKHKDEQWEALLKFWNSKADGKIDAARLEKLSKPTLHVIPPKPPLVKKFSVSKEEKSALINRMELEMANELKSLHTAILLSEVERIREMFRLGEAETRQLRLASRQAVDQAVDKARGKHKSFVSKWVNYEVNTYDIDPTAFSFNRRYIRVDREKKPEDKISRYHLRASVERRSSHISIGVGGHTGMFVGVCWVKDGDVRNQEIWMKTLAGIIDADKLQQYKKNVESRLRSTFVDLMMTALRFDLEIPDSKVPIVRERIDDRNKEVDASRIRFIERTIGRSLQKLKANDLADILTEKQLTQRTDTSAKLIKSSIVDLVLDILEFDLHLSKSQLPAIRKRLEGRGYPGSIQGRITEEAARVRWKLKLGDFADILTEQQQRLWPLTQHK